MDNYRLNEILDSKPRFYYFRYSNLRLILEIIKHPSYVQVSGDQCCG